MVSGLSIFLMILSLLLIVLFPLILSVVMYRKYKYKISAIFIGALTFTIFQLVTRIPLLSVLAGMEWYKGIMSNLYVAALFLAGTAGIFEETGRYIMYKLLLKNKHTWSNGIAFGIGHGGIEALLLVGISFIANIIMSFMINSGLFDKAFSAQMTEATMNIVKSTLVDTPSYMFALAGIERVMAICMHIAFSVMVLYGIKTKRPVFLLCSILAHTAVNFPAVVLPGLGVSNVIVEAVLALFAAASIIYTIKSKKHFDRYEQEDNGFNEDEALKADALEQ
ncbi:MAG: YhfC family intramembrane metalloprotease [Bacillota bacterium]